MKPLIVLMVLLAAASTLNTVRLGRCLTQMMPTRDEDSLSSQMQKHRRSANITLLLWLAAIVTTEAYVRSIGGASLTPLFLVHLVFAATAFVLLLVARFLVTGIKSWRAHRIIAYTCLGTYIVALVTGGVLLAGT